MNIQLGKGDFLTRRLKRRRFRRWIIEWTATMWRPCRARRLQMSLIKTPNNFCWSSREFLGEMKCELPLYSYFTMVRKDWDFSNGAHCNTRSRWCGLKHSLSVCILNASQSKSNPVCATLVCCLTFPPPGSARPCYSNETRLNTITGRLDVKTYWLFYHDHHLNPVSSRLWFDNGTDASLHAKHDAISV